MASSSSSSSWMPSQGRHSVNIGPSFGRAIKARKLKGSPAPTPKRSNLPERDFYAFRFNFKASSIDGTKPASIESKKGSENTQVLAEYPSTQPNEAHVFSGSELPAKEVDCILIYDEDTGQYTLEKLDSFVLLKYDGKKVISPHPASPAPVASSSSSSSRKEKGRQDDDDDLERATLGLDDRAEGEADDAVPAVSRRQEEEEEEEEGEMIEIPPRRPSPPPKPQPPPPKAARAVKAMPKARVELKTQAAPPQASQSKAPAAPPPLPKPTPKAPAAAPAAAKAKPAQSKTKKASKPAIPLPQPALPPPAPAASTSYADEEVMEFGRPAKRARPAATPQRPPPPPPPATKPGLSLPGGSGYFAPPPAPGSTKASSASRGAPAATTVVPLPAAAPDLDSDDDDEEYWEPVGPTATANGNSSAPTSALDALEQSLEEDIFGDGFADQDADADMEAEVFGDADGGDEEEEIDVNAFEAELNEQMEASDEYGEDEDMEEVASTREPISLNRLASGGAAGDSDEEYSSSEESDFD